MEPQKPRLRAWLPSHRSVQSRDRFPIAQPAGSATTAKAQDLLYSLLPKTISFSQPDRDACNQPKPRDHQTPNSRVSKSTKQADVVYIQDQFSSGQFILLSKSLYF